MTFLDWHAPDERRRHTYEAFARQVALTLENAHLLDSLRDQVSRVQASEERLRLALSAGSMGWWEWDLQTDHVSYGDALAEVFGFPAGAPVRTYAALLEAAHPADRAEVEALLDRAVVLGAGFRVEFRVGPAVGPVRWVDVAGQVQADAAGRPMRIVGVARDVSALKQAEAALRQVQQTGDRLEGILLAVREVGRLLSNDLQLPIGMLDMMERLPGVPLPARDMAEEALGWLTTAQGHVRQFQRVVRVETKQTPLGPALDLERSTQPISP
ncbi:MAG TPA: PAS domain-containing protein [Chloroflexota bacterium]